MPVIPDWAKKVLAVLAAVCGAVVVQWPGTVYAQVAQVVLAVLAGLGLLSGGVGAFKSESSAAVHRELEAKNLIGGGK